MGREGKKTKNRKTGDKDTTDICLYDIGISVMILWSVRLYYDRSSSPQAPIPSGTSLLAQAVGPLGGSTGLVPAFRGCSHYCLPQLSRWRGRGYGAGNFAVVSLLQEDTGGEEE
jgi:hypothetical protein